ncbi:MAG TPA: DUF808 family protein, partial [Nannocystaceae bacterium]|nr:DUF808 family protein [Nannocystaceae bacterium]
AGIVKLDDLGMSLSKRKRTEGLGRAILRSAPWLMKGLSVAGTVAMFLVGGGILVHGIPPLHHLVEPLGGALAMLIDLLTGLVAGGIVVAVVTLVQRLRKRSG